MSMTTEQAATLLTLADTDNLLRGVESAHDAFQESRKRLGPKSDETVSKRKTYFFLGNCYHREFRILHQEMMARVERRRAYKEIFDKHGDNWEAVYDRP